jgi:hypothetical protein
MITTLDAARLVVADYNEASVNVVEKLDIKGVQTSIIDVSKTERIGLIRGTNQFSDWLRYNLDILPEILPGDKYAWCRGFLHHSQISYAFLKSKGCTMIVGHSLGAAAGGIVATSLNIPAILFATPMALSGIATPINADIVMNYCREDDIVTRLPFAFLGFRHLGIVNWLRPIGPHIGIEHSILHYIELLETIT